MVRASGSGFKRLSAPAANDDWWPSFSPDATTVLYSRQTLSSYEMRPEWRMVDVTGRNDRLVWTHPEQDGFNYWCPPQWTPNGKRLATIRHEQLTSSGWSAALVTFSLSGQDERRAFTFPAKTVRAFAGVQCQFSWQRAG